MNWRKQGLGNGIANEWKVKTKQNNKKWIEKEERKKQHSHCSWMLNRERSTICYARLNVYVLLAIDAWSLSFLFIYSFSLLYFSSFFFRFLSLSHCVWFGLLVCVCFVVIVDESTIVAIIDFDSTSIHCQTNRKTNKNKKSTYIFISVL